MASAQLTLFGREKDLDDKYILMQTMCYDGYFVSNDNNMHKHFLKSNLFIRNPKKACLQQRPHQSKELCQQGRPETRLEKDEETTQVAVVEEVERSDQAILGACRCTES